MLNCNQKVSHSPVTNGPGTLNNPPDTWWKETWSMVPHPHSLWSMQVVPRTSYIGPGLWLHIDPGTKILDQGSLYVTPSVRSNHNENILLLTEGHLG